MAARYELSYPGLRAALSTSLERNGHNVFDLEGTLGLLRIEDPFIQARRLRILKGAAAESRLLRPDKIPGSAQKLIARLPFPGQQIMAFNYPGNGLQFEAQEVADAVRFGRTSADIAPLNDSTAVLKMIETILSQPPSMA